VFFIQAVQRGWFDPTINIGQIGTMVVFVGGFYFVWRQLVENVTWIKGLLSEYRPHIHAGKSASLMRDDLVFPRELDGPKK
jgi:hypothetical protein